MELLVADALFRIKSIYEKANGKIYLSFSGGKDSTVLAHLYIMAIRKYDLKQIDFVFVNTGLELVETINFVKWFQLNVYENVIHIFPTNKDESRLLPQEVFKNYGKPAISKENDDRLKTFHNQVIKNGLSVNESIEKSSRIKQLFGLHEKWPHKKLAKKNKWAIDYVLNGNVISDKCCLKLKKEPFHKYSKKTGNTSKLLGVRQDESMLRKRNYSSCFIKDSKNNYIGTPIYDWTDENIDQYILEQNIKLSDAYLKLGFSRTGCFCCPYNREVLEEMEIIKQYNPNQYYYGIKLLGDILEIKEKHLPKAQYVRLIELRNRLKQLSIYDFN